MSRKRIVLTGASGQIGWELQRTLSTLGKVVALDSTRLDLTNTVAIRQLMQGVAPAMIVNAAAYTAVDQAESETELAHAVNATAPAVLAEEAERLGALLVHYSTDYVFNGRGTTPWREDDAVDPLNVYGESKLVGERAIQASGCDHLIFRTSWVYGMRGNNFLNTMRRLMQEREMLNVVTDQMGAPTWCRDVAEATAQILGQISSPAWRESKPNPWGVYHLCNAGEISWLGFAEAIRAHYGQDTSQTLARLLPVSSSDYPTAARRPLNSRLNHDKVARTFGLRLQDWRLALALCMDVG